MARRRHNDSRQRPVQCPSCPRSDTRRLDGAIEAAVELPELLEMRAVARLVQVKHDNHEARTIVITTDATGRLDVLRRRFWLALNHHQSKP